MLQALTWNRLPPWTNPQHALLFCAVGVTASRLIDGKTEHSTLMSAFLLSDSGKSKAREKLLQG